MVEPVDEIKILLKHRDQGLFLQSMLSATIFKSIFEFWIWIPNVVSNADFSVVILTYGTLTLVLHMLTLVC